MCGKIDLIILYSFNIPCQRIHQRGKKSTLKQVFKGCEGMKNIEEIIQKPLVEITIEDIQRLSQELSEARSILYDCVNTSSVCNEQDYRMMRKKAFDFLSK